MLAHDLLRGFDAFHLRHGDVHQDDIGFGTVVFGHRRNAVSSFAGQLSAECLNHAGQIFPGEHRVVHYQIADRLPVFAAFYGCKLFHHKPPAAFFRARTRANCGPTNVAPAQRKLFRHSGSLRLFTNSSIASAL